MLEYLKQLDAELLCTLNGWNCPYADQLMWLVSGKFSSALIIIVLLALLARHRSWRGILTFVIMTALVVLLADRISSGIIKPIVERLRPTHDPDLQNIVHVVNGYRGGLYGFVSSHAANLFGIATLISLVLRNRGSWLAMMAIISKLNTMAKLIIFASVWLNRASGAGIAHFFESLFHIQNTKNATPMPITVPPRMSPG